MRTAPHQCPRKPNDGCKSSRDPCQGNCPSLVKVPAMILAVREFGSSVGMLCERGSRLGGLKPQSKIEKNYAISKLKL